MRLALKLGSRNKLFAYLGQLEGSTALHNAAARGDVDLCASLIAFGANPTLRNSMGRTPLQHARWALSGSKTGPVPPSLVAALEPQRAEATAIGAPEGEANAEGPRDWRHEPTL